MCKKRKKAFEEAKNNFRLSVGAINSAISLFTEETLGYFETTKPIIEHIKKIGNLPVDEKLKIHQIEDFSKKWKNKFKIGNLFTNLCSSFIIAPLIAPLLGVPPGIMLGLIALFNCINQKHLKNLYISIYQRDSLYYNNNAINLNCLSQAIHSIKSLLDDGQKTLETIGYNYLKFSEQDKEVLVNCLNIMKSGHEEIDKYTDYVKPHYSNEDFQKFLASRAGEKFIAKREDLIVILADLLFSINYDKRGSILLWKSLRKNKEFLKACNTKKRLFSYKVMSIVSDALYFKERNDSLC